MSDLERDPIGDLEQLIEVRGLSVRYGERQILKGLDIDIGRGQIVVIMGGSGSGKSTFLRHLLGLERPVSGSVRLMGEELGTADARRVRALRRYMGVAFQSGALLSSLSVGENVLLPVREHTRLPEDLLQVMLRLKLELVQLPGCEDLMPAELSGGMIKRVALARALIMDPPLLFLDEPSAGLDPVVAVAVDELLVRLRDQIGVSVVIVTHELESAFKVADRICVLDRGEIIALGSVEEVKASNSDRVQALLNRRIETPDTPPGEYLEQLMGRNREIRVN